MDNAIKSQLHEMDEPQHALQSLADALPALGIVAAVLGVVKTMGSISEPPEVLGGMIGSALVGTFLGRAARLWHCRPAGRTAEAGQFARRADFADGEAGGDRLAARLSAAAGGGKRALRPQPRASPGADRTARYAAGQVEWRACLPETHLPRASTDAARRPRCAFGTDHRQEGDRPGRRRASRRRVESGLCRFRHRDDGLLPAALAARRDHRGPAQGAGGLFHPDAGANARELRRIGRDARRLLAH